MSGAQPIRVTGIRGRVTRGPYARGSKSEREALFLESVEGRYLLRRKTGPVFDDAELERYVDHNVVCDGFLVGTSLLAERVDIERDPPS